MPGFCAIHVELDSTEKERAEINVITKTEKWWKNNKITNTEFSKKIMTGFSDYVRWYTKDAKYVDALKDIYDRDKIRKRFGSHANDIKKIYKPIEGNEQLMKTYFQYQEIRRNIRNIKGMENSDVLNVLEYKQWRSTNMDKSVDDYRSFLNKKLKDYEKAITSNAQLSEVHRGMNKHYSDMIAEIAKIDPELVNKLSGGENMDPMSIVDQIVNNMRSFKDVKPLNEFYKKTLGVDMKVAVDNPNFLDLITTHMVDMYHKQAMLHKTFMDGNINDKLRDIVKGMDTKEINKDFINKLPEDNAFKQAWNEALMKIDSRPEFRRIAKKYSDLGNLSDFEIVSKTLNEIASIELMESSNFRNNKSFINFMESRKNNYPELYKLSQNRSFDSEKALEELSRYNKEKGVNYEFDNTSINNALEIKALRDSLKTKLREETFNRAKDVIKELKNKFPNYTLVTRNGTAPFGVEMDEKDISKNDETLGHLVDLTNPDLLVNDITDMMNLQANGQEALIKMIEEGKINLIPKDQAESLSRVKKLINANVSHFKLNKLNKIFSETTLFAPWNIPGYMLGTQIWGNLGHTMMADPAAFKHWGKMVGNLRKIFTLETDPITGKKKVFYDYDKIENEDERKIIKLLTTSEGSSILGMTSDDFAFLNDPEFLADMVEIENSRSQKKLTSVWNKWMKNATTAVTFVEAVSRGSMALEILQKQRKDGVYIPPTANKLRVDHLWGIDPHLAAVRVANDTHIDYANLHPIIRKIGRWAPFFSYIGGSTVNMSRQVFNTYNAVREATKTGNWKTANSYLGRGAVAVAWRMGIAATIWGTVMVALGVLSPEKRQQLNEQNKSNILNSLFGKMGIHLDNNFYIPGTGVKLVDSALRLNKGNQKGDVFADPEALIPGLDDYWRKDGLKGATMLAAGKIAGRMSPIIKTPIEMAMGGGSITETGYIAPRQGQSYFETVTSKLAAFAGLGTITRTAFDMAHGSPNDFRSDAAYDVNKFSTQFYNENQDQDLQEAKIALTDRMRHMDPDGTTDAVAAYEKVLAEEGKTPSQIHSSIRNIFDSHSLANMLNKDKDGKLTAGMSQDELKRLQKAIQAQNQFYNTLGYGRW